MLAGLRDQVASFLIRITRGNHTVKKKKIIRTAENRHHGSQLQVFLCKLSLYNYISLLIKQANFFWNLITICIAPTVSTPVTIIF